MAIVHISSMGHRFITVISTRRYQLKNLPNTLTLRDAIEGIYRVRSTTTSCKFPIVDDAPGLTENNYNNLSSPTFAAGTAVTVHFSLPVRCCLTFNERLLQSLETSGMTLDLETRLGPDRS